MCLSCAGQVVKESDINCKALLIHCLPSMIHPALQSSFPSFHHVFLFVALTVLVLFVWPTTMPFAISYWTLQRSGEWLGSSNQVRFWLYRWLSLPFVYWAWRKPYDGKPWGPTTAINIYNWSFPFLSFLYTNSRVSSSKV